MFARPVSERFLRQRSSGRFLVLLVTFVVIAVGLGIPPAAPARAALANVPHYSLPLALQESQYFYDAEKSGPSRTAGDQPLDWRGDSEPSDAAIPLVPMSKNVGTNMSAAFIAANKSVLDPTGKGTVNLSGGFHDAGDHVKFGLPQTYAASTLAWGMYLFPQAYTATGTWAHGLDELRWFSDYFLRSLFTDASGNVVAFAYQVGEGGVDHAYWGPSELQSSTLYPRPAYFATSETPASDQTAGAAAALASEAMVVKSSDAAYAAQCLKAAQALYAFSVAHRGLGYSGGFYGSSSDDDELAWAAAWLYLATGTHTYLDDIVSTNAAGTYTGWMKKIVTSTNETWQNIWVMSWDAKWGGVFSLIDPLVQGDAAIPAAVQSAVHYFDKWQIEYWSHVPHDNASDTNVLAWTPGGFGVLSTWGSARYNTAAQLEALAYRRSFPTDPKSPLFTDWAMGQMNYIMGDNPLKRSYIVGFGSTMPVIDSQVGGSAVAASHPHHADAHGSLTNNQDDPPNDKHVLWGGLVGGPDASDQHNDLTTDFVLNEVAVDYNAAFVGALAGLYQYYGQSQTMTKFTPTPEAAETGYYTNAVVNQATNQGTQVTVTVNNVASQPPHFETDMSARYFFDISAIHAHGQTIADVTTPIYYDASAQIDSHPTAISAPVRWGDASSCLYYVSIDWTGVQLSGSRAFEFGVNSAMGPGYLFYWDSTKSPSYTGLAAGTYAATPDPYIPVYLGGKLTYGQEPSLTADEGCGATSSPSPTTASPSPTTASPSPTTTSPSPTTSSPSPTGSKTCTAALVVTNAWTGGFNATVTVTAGSTAIAGWTVTLTLPSGAAVTSLWNGVNTGTSGAVRVTNASYNGALGSAQSTSFGFQGTGSSTGTTVSCAAV
jgi:endoglucanase